MFKKSKKPVYLSQADRDYIRQKLEVDKARKKTLKAQISFKSDGSSQEVVETSYFKDDDELKTYSISFLNILNSISEKTWKITKIEKTAKVNDDNDDNEEI